MVLVSCGIICARRRLGEVTTKVLLQQYMSIIGRVNVCLQKGALQTLMGSQIIADEYLDLVVQHNRSKPQYRLD